MPRIDDNQFADLYRRHAHVMRGIILRDQLWLTREDAEDITQDAWLRAWQTWDAAKADGGDFVGWVWRQARFLLGRRARTLAEKARQATMPAVDREEHFDGQPGAVDVSWIDGNRVQIARDHLGAIVAWAVARDASAPTSRSATQLILSLAGGAGTAEAAQAAGCASPAAGRMFITTIRRQLQEAIA